MKLFRSKSKAKCSVEHLYNCMTDIGYLKSEIKLSNDNSDRKASINYDHTEPFSTGKKIIIKTKSSCMTLIVQENKAPSYLQLMLTPGKKMRKVFGTATIKVNIQSHGKYSKYDTLFEIDKDPSGVARLFIKFLALFFKISSWPLNRRFVRYAESTA